MVRFFCVKYTKMLSFFLIAEVLTGLIYHRPAGENSSFQFTPLVYQVTGIVYEVEEFRSSVSVTCLKIVGQNKNVSSAVRTIHIKDARTEKQENQSVPIVRGHILRHTKGVQNTKNRHSGNTFLTTKNICLNC